MKALEKRPEMRYPTMDEFIRAMSDPINYVEAHGGLTGFLQRQLMPSHAPLPVRLTPAPMTMSTPIPGTQGMTGVMNSPVPGSLSSPTTLGASAGQVQGGKSKTPFIIAGAITMAAAAAAVIFVVAGHKKTTTPSNAGAGSDTGSAVVVKMDNGSGSANLATTNPPVPVDAAPPPPPPVDAAPPPPPVDAAEAKPAITMTRVTVTSTPPGAEIYINGAPLHKQTPAELTLPAGDARLSLRLKGYSEFKSTVSPKGDTMNVDASLKKAATVVVPPGGKKPCKDCLERPD